MPRDLGDQLVKYLADAHAMEVQALAQMRAAPDLARDERLAAAFRFHLVETERHESLVRARLHARGAAPSKLEDMLGAVSGKGFVLFAKLNPDTPGKLAAHAFSYEHLELAVYDLLARVADRANDVETAEAARAIRTDEEAMARRLSELWDAALRDAGKLESYLADAHALEAQSIALLQRAPKVAGELAPLFEEHLAQTREHMRALEQRAKPSALKDAALRLGGLNWSGFFAAQRDTPAKLAAFAYAFEHLEIAGYELLRRVAARDGDAETVALAERILPEERAAAEKLFGAFEPALNASLDAVLSA
jgi:ferritin-like metal-binding protein YciE